jgi:hypothetical protein
MLNVFLLDKTLAILGAQGNAGHQDRQAGWGGFSTANMYA